LTTDHAERVVGIAKRTTMVAEAPFIFCTPA